MISVIVPVFNVEKYICECIDSILAQTYSSFELILVDDGSEDRCGTICDEYKERDSRIRVFHKENGGLSSARNIGIDEAKGEFICFVDSDDSIRKDYLEILYNCITETNAEIAICDIDAPKLTKVDRNTENVNTMNADEARKWLYDMRSREYVLMVVAWNKLYRKSLFDGIRYPEGRIHEDEFIIEPILKRCSMIYFIPDKLYIYRNNENGITSAANNMNVKHLDGVDALVERIDSALIENKGIYAFVTLRNALCKCARFYADALNYQNDEMKKASLIKYNLVYMRFKDLLNTRQRIKYFLFRIAPIFFIKLFNP